MDFDCNIYCTGLLAIKQKRIEQELNRLYTKAISIENKDNPRLVEIQCDMMLKINDLTQVMQQIELLNKQ